MQFKCIVLLIWSSGSPFVWQSVSICAIWVKGIMRNNSVKIILNLGQYFRRRCRLKCFLSGTLAALLFGRVCAFVQFG